MAGPGVAGQASAASGSTPRFQVTWRLLWRASLPSENLLESVAATGPDDIWAVGGPGRDSRAGYVVHFDGHKWRMSGFPDRTFMPSVVGASSPSDVWVTGESATASDEAYHWNGSAWQHVSTPAGVSTGVPLEVFGSADVWLAGGREPMPPRNSLVWHWNGSAWKSYGLPIDVDPSTWMAGSSPRSLWVAGKGKKGSSLQGRLAAYQWTGRSWRSMPVPHERITALPSVTVSPRGDVWIEALSVKGTQRNPLYILLHRHGGKWAKVPGVNSQGGLSWPPTADGQGRIWFNDYKYWTGTSWTLSRGPRSCRGGVTSLDFPAMQAIPGGRETLAATNCARIPGGREQGIVMISEVSKTP